MNRSFFLVLLVFFSTCLRSQSRFADSLKKLIPGAKEDSTKVFMFTDIADELTDIDFKQSLVYGQQGLVLAEKIGFKKGIAQAYSTLANAYSDQSDYVQCLDYNLKALQVREELGNASQIAASYDNIGNVYNDQGNFTRALEYYDKSRTISEKNKDIRALSQLYNNIGNAYANKGDLKKSVYFLFKALTLKDELGNKKGAANTANNIAVVYKMQGNYQEALNYNLKALAFRLALRDSMGLGFSYTNLGLAYRNLKDEEKASENFIKALSIFKRLGYQKGIATVNNNLGLIYVAHNEYNKAELSYKEALAVFESEEDKMGIATALSNLAGVYGKLKRDAEAAVLFERAEKLAKEAGSYEVLKELYDHYSEYFEDKKDYRNAYNYHVLFSEAQDSLRADENSSALAEMKTQYETNIKDKENDNLIAENRVKDLTISQKNIQRNVFIILFISMIVIAVLLISRVQLKKKEELSKQLLVQQEIRSKSVIEAEAKERSRIARELHDGIGQQLSAAKLNISALQSFLKNPDDSDKLMIQNAIDLLDDSVKEVRNVSHSMIPNALIKFGLVSAVREFINKISSTGNLKVNLEIVGLIERLEKTKEAVLFRVLQEVVTNILRHANASEIGIQLVKHDHELSIVVEDNGVGFDVEKIINSEKGIGLKNIQSRVDFLNGSVFFDSRPTKGTTVTIEIPM